LRSVRTPDERLGDLEAQIVANHVGLQAMVKMAGAYGIEKVQKYGSALLDYSQAFMARTIDTLPDGEWTCADFMEDDGDGNPVKIHVKLTISGDRARLDFSDSADQVRGCINCPSAVTKSAVYYCFGCLMGNDAPLNGGCFRNIDILTREGSVVHAVYPSAVVAGNTETSQRIVDVVLGALSKAVPDRIPASSCGTMSSVALGGDGWTYYETIGGGCGAGPTWEGESAVQCHMTNTLNTPAEAIEMQYPLRVLRFERATSTGGEGEYRGGDGIVREIQVLHSCSGTVLGDRRIGRPRGLAGGDDGLNGQNNVIQNQTAVALRGMSTVELLPGDCLRIQTPGGGGFGKWAGK
jgi:N-methylhydantoinase B